ncbi:MAG: MotA/TolQ/ExbB proton channel family protein [Deltaproteobacteria bacterium]|nr:MotA/TolQ/ExbB proton channel family protein [Deltaproteobacteria bacterium]
MDVATIIGLASGIAMIAAVVLAQGGLPAYLNLHALLLVGGGVTATAFIMFDLRTVMGSIRVAVRAFRDDTWNLEEIIRQMVHLSKLARANGILSLEGAERDVRNPFLKKGLQLAVDGNEEGLIRFVMATDVSFTRERHLLGQKVFRQMGAMAPAFGMIGTLIGLVDMLRKMEDPSEIGPAMSVALVCTLYGAVLANLVCLPIANKLEYRMKEEALAKQVVIEGIVSIMQGANPKLLKQKLEAFVSPAMRKPVREEARPARPDAEEAA